MTDRIALRLAALAGGMAVALGAFGAHTLKETLTEHGTIALWEKAVLYHFVHALMLFILGTRRPIPRGPWFSFMGGILLFSGSLYALALTQMRWLGALTPLGGVGFLLGWVWLILSPEPSSPPGSPGKQSEG